MSRPKAAQRVAAANVAPTLAALLSPARAEASRKNGARSKGPKTAAGKARSSRNALKHGLCAEHHVVVEGESAEAFAAFEAALVADLAPAGALQMLLAGRIARAAWRLERAERIEAELFARQMEDPFGDGDLGLALIRDGNGARAFDTLLRYRGAARPSCFAPCAPSKHSRPRRPRRRCTKRPNTRSASDQSNPRASGILVDRGASRARRRSRAWRRRLRQHVPLHPSRRPCHARRPARPQNNGTNPRAPAILAIQAVRPQTAAPRSAAARRCRLPPKALANAAAGGSRR